VSEPHTDTFLKTLFRLLFEETDHDQFKTTIHLFVPMARMIDLLFPVHQELVEQHCVAWANALQQNNSGVRGWMQLAALLTAAYKNLWGMVSTTLRPTLFEFFLVRGAFLVQQLDIEDDHQARTVGREVDAMMSCMRDFVPRLLAGDLLDVATRAQLARICHDGLFACRWTQIHCGVGGMALAVLEADDAALIKDLENEQYDVGARLCLCRGICNSRSNNMKLMEQNVWPFISTCLQGDIASMSTTNRHFLISALDSLGRSPNLEDKDLILAVTRLVVVNFDSTVHGPLDYSTKNLYKLMQKNCSSAEIKKIYDSVWNQGRAPVWGPLDHFLRFFDQAFLAEYVDDSFVGQIVRACGDIRMKPGAIRVFNSYLSIGGTGWDQDLRAAMESKNKTLHLTVAQHLIPAVLKTLEATESVVKKLLGDSESLLLRLALASHLNNQKRPLLEHVIPDKQLVRDGLVAYNPWIRRYALETAVAMQEEELVRFYITNMAKEHSQSQRSNASGALCRWWKTKAGSQSVVETEDILASNLYTGSPSSRQGTVAMWLASRKTFGKSLNLQKMLVEMLGSRYDANRAIATKILRREYRGAGVFADPQERELLLNLSLKTLKCIRIRISDSGARLFTLLYDGDAPMVVESLNLGLEMLENHIAIGKTDFSKLASQFTLHGPLLIMKYLLVEQSQHFTKEHTQRLLKCCRDVMDLCEGFVCDNTLEGMSDNVKVRFGGEDNEEEDGGEEEDLSSGSHVRVCAWRGVREACLVIGSAMGRLLSLMTEEDITQTTDVLLNIVLKSKHRGALENASIGLEQTCISCLKTTDSFTRLLPLRWLEKVLSFDAKSMGTVRRSAGIPYAICVILRSEWLICSKRDSNTPLVSFTMKQILGQIDSEVTDSTYLVMTEKDVGYYRIQVHHLNILRHILRDSSLSDILRPYLEELLLLSLKMWNHKEWSIRNSASLLFASAMMKLDPDTTNGKDVNETLKLKKFEFSFFHNNFAKLLAHVEEVLKKHSESIDKIVDMFSDLFPILLILKKLHIATPTELSQRLYGYCVILSGHCNQMIRHGAAKCAAALTSPEEYENKACWAIARSLDSLLTSTNRAYGYLYCALEFGVARVSKKTVLKLPEAELNLVPALCSLRCPPVAWVMYKVISVWNLYLPAPLVEMIDADVKSFSLKEKGAVVPVMQSALEQYQAFRSQKSTEQEASKAPAEEEETKPVKLKCEEGSDEPVRELFRDREKDMVDLVALLQSEEKRERKQACTQFQRLFPEFGSTVFHPCYALKLLFSALIDKEFAAWSVDFMVQILRAPVMSEEMQEFATHVNMKTVFEKEDNSQFSENILLMQLAAKQLLSLPSDDNPLGLSKDSSDAFLATLDQVAQQLQGPAAETSHWDSHFWQSLFEPLFSSICLLKVLQKHGVDTSAMEAKLKKLDMPHLLKEALEGNRCDFLVL
jgi:hypothetical protein